MARLSLFFFFQLYKLIHSEFYKVVCGGEMICTVKSKRWVETRMYSYLFALQYVVIYGH